LLVEGNNTIVFHPNQGTLESWAYYTTFKYNNLTVVATKPVVPGYDYETSVSPSVVEDYVIGESCNVSVSAIHGDFGDMESDVTVWQVYVNGADTGFKTSVDAMTDSFLFDLADIADLLVEGNNTIVFHPNQGTLESWAYYTTFKYNNLTVVATKPVSIYTGIIYVDATNGNDDNNGSSDRPVATISKAIELASSENNNEHKIIISEGTYIEHDLNITSALDISANGNVVIDAQELGRIFDIKADTNITGITFKNGKSDNGGAISIKDAKVSIDNSLFENNEASSYGSAIYWNANDGVLTNTKFTNNTGRNGVVSLGVFSWSTGATGKRTLIDNCIFDDNHNVEYGNCIGLDVTGSDVTVKNTNFTNNIGEYGSEHGALYIKGDDVVVDNCLFENNAMGMAAAIQIDGENALINNSIFINNTVSGYPARSGAIEVQNAATITNNIFIANGGEECIQGGAIDVVYNVYGGDVIISNNQFFNNSAKNGGAIFVDGGSQDMAEFDSLTISENVFDGDSAENGAGIYTENSDVEVTIINNEFNRLSAKSGSCVYSDGVELGVSGNTVKECTSEDGNTMSNEYADTYGDFPVNPTIEISTNNPAFGENATITVKLPGSSTANVVITVDNNVVADTNLDNGVLTVTVSNLSVGNHSVVVTFAGDANYTDGTNQTTLTVSKANISVDDALTITVPKGNNSAIFTINLPSDANGTLNVTVDGKSYVENVTNGTASITVDNLASGVHNISVIYSGDDNYEGANKNTSITIEGTDAAKQNDVTPAKPAAPATTTSVTPAATKIVAKNKTFKAKKKIKKYSITLKTKAGKPVAKVKVTLKVKGKTYIAKTNAKGKVVFKLKKLTKKGTYKAKISFKGNSLYKASSKTVKIIIKK
jgi:hypothetical protein